MVRAPEAEMPTGVTPEGASVERPKWWSREEPRDRLLTKFREISNPLVDFGSMPFYTSSVTFGTNIDRSPFQAPVPYQLMDVIRGVKILDFNKEDESKKMDLEVELTPFSLKISNPTENVSLLFHMNAQDTLFDVSLRPFDPKKPFANQELADAAKDTLKQSKRRISNNLGYIHYSYAREFDVKDDESGEYVFDESGYRQVEKYDIYDANNIAEDEHTADTLLDAFQTIVASGSLEPLRVSNDRFIRNHPGFTPGTDALKRAA